MSETKKPLKIVRSRAEMWRTVIAALQLIVGITTLIVVIVR